MTKQTYNSTAALGEFALALIAEPFGGKTCLAGEIMPPNFHVICAEFKLATMVERIKGKPFTYSQPYLADDGSVLPMNKVFSNTVKHCEDALKDPTVSGIIVDSITSLGEFLEAHLVQFSGTGKDLMIGGEKCMTQSHWTPYRDLMRKFFVALRAYGKPVVCIFHERLVEDQTGSNVLRPMVGGQSKDTVTKLFTDSWRIIVKPAANAKGYKRLLRTEPLHNMGQLGHSSPTMPAELELLEDPTANAEQIRKHYPMLCTH